MGRLVPPGRMPGSTAGETPAATFAKHHTHKIVRAWCRCAYALRAGGTACCGPSNQGRRHAVPPVLTDSAVNHQMPVADDFDTELIQRGFLQLIFNLLRGKRCQQAVVEVPL